MASKADQHQRGQATLADDEKKPQQQDGSIDIETQGVLDAVAQLEPNLRRLEQLRKEYGSTWGSPGDPADPYNWPRHRKVATGILFSLAALITLMTASMIAAALQDISRDIGINASEAQMVFSVYFLGLGFGPFVVAALAELHGRKWVWVLGNVWYILWNAVSPVGSSKALMIVGRLMTGLGASAGNTLIGPAMADMYGARDRGKAAAIASLLPSLGPALGPIVGGIVTQYIAWPWIFWVMSIANAAMTVAGILYIRESYTPVLLRRKARGESQPNPSDVLQKTHFLRLHFWQEFLSRLGAGMWRPVRLLLTRPVIQLIAFISALNFATYTLLLGSYANMFMQRYGQSPSVSSLHYIALAVGATVSAQAGGRVMDWWYRRLADRLGAADDDGGRRGRPEFRAPYLAGCVLLAPAGLVLYGWSAERGLPWPVVDVGAAIYCVGSFAVMQVLTAYQLDEFVRHGASAMAATRVLSYALGFAFPLFAPGLYQNLGYGWGNSMLALLWVVFCLPLPAVLWYWGEKLRAMGRSVKEGQMEGA